jgi:hypothetical protein
MEQNYEESTREQKSFRNDGLREEGDQETSNLQ